MALAHHDAAGRDQRRGGESEFVGAEECTDDDVAAGAQAAIHLYGNASAQTVDDKCLMGFGEADFPGATGVLDGGEGRGAGAAFEAGNGHVVGARLGDARCNRAHANL